MQRILQADTCPNYNQKQTATEPRA